MQAVAASAVTVWSLVGTVVAIQAAKVCFGSVFLKQDAGGADAELAA